MILNNRKGGHSLRFFKDGKSKIKLSGGYIVCLVNKSLVLLYISRIY